MGYTHYWHQRDTVSPANWIEFAEGCERLFALVAASGVTLNDWSGDGEDGGRPTANGKEVSFNGTGEESHESFRIERRLRKGESGGFTKTARKGYDTAVAAVLLYLDSVEPGAFEVTSDGHLWEYRDALDLARAAWPAKANLLDFPRSLRSKARFASYTDRSDAYQVCEGLDGPLYIEAANGDLRRLPADMQGEAYQKWVRDVPHDMRKWGSFKGDHDACETKRLAAVWMLAAGAPVPPVVYNPLTHGEREPHRRNAQDYAAERKAA